MSKFIQLHLLTCYPPSNANSSDDGQPKTVKFGNTTRGRHSSQCVKHSVRNSNTFNAALEHYKGTRTLEVGQIILNHLSATAVPPAKAERIATILIRALKKLPANLTSQEKKDKAAKAKAKDKAAKASPKIKEGESVEEDDTIAAATSEWPDITLKSDQMLFLSPDEIARLKELADKLVQDENFQPKVDDILLRCDTAIDIAMHGRMVASAPEYRVTAAVSVAHRFTTNAVVVEDDYFTAMDDLKRDDQQGAGHLGAISYLPMSIFYTYVTIDYDLLIENLGGDNPTNRRVAEDAIKAVTTSLIIDTPSGKRATFNHNTVASYVRVERGKAAPTTGAAAFINPVSDVVQSADRLRSTLDAIAAHQTYKNDVLELDVNSSGAGIVTFEQVAHFAATGKRPE